MRADFVHVKRSSSRNFIPSSYLQVEHWKRWLFEEEAVLVDVEEAGVLPEVVLGQEEAFERLLTVSASRMSSLIVRMPLRNSQRKNQLEKVKS